MQISDRIKSIKPSLTLAMNAKALELKEQGVMVTSLAVGEPDFPTPKHICEAAKAAIDSNFCRYTAVPGIRELRKAVCGYYSNQYDLTIRPENVIISNGGKQALYNYIMCTVNPGDEESKDHMLLTVEREKGYTNGIDEGLKARLADELHKALFARVDVAVTDPGKLPRTFSKSKRVVDQR